jgi:hypothetical protein
MGLCTFCRGMACSQTMPGRLEARGSKGLFVNVLRKRLGEALGWHCPSARVFTYVCDMGRLVSCTAEAFEALMGHTQRHTLINSTCLHSAGLSYVVVLSVSSMAWCLCPCALFASFTLVASCPVRDRQLRLN